MATLKTKSGARKLPSYATMMADYHRAFAAELKDIIDSLPVRPGNRCSTLPAATAPMRNGWLGGWGPVARCWPWIFRRPFWIWLARRPCDRRRAGEFNFFRLTSRLLRWCPIVSTWPGAPESVQPARTGRGPEADGRGGAAGRQRGRFENDEFHHILFPWPVEIELAHQEGRARLRCGDLRPAAEAYVGRELCRLFRAAGLTQCKAQGLVFTRQAPLDRASRAFFTAYLDDLSRRVNSHLEPSLRDLFHRLASPRSGCSCCGARTSRSPV